MPATDWSPSAHPSESGCLKAGSERDCNSDAMLRASLPLLLLLLLLILLLLLLLLLLLVRPLCRVRAPAH